MAYQEWHEHMSDRLKAAEEKINRLADHVVELEATLKRINADMDYLRTILPPVTVPPPVEPRRITAHGIKPLRDLLQSNYPDSEEWVIWADTYGGKFSLDYDAVIVQRGQPMPIEGRQLIGSTAHIRKFINNRLNADKAHLALNEAHLKANLLAACQALVEYLNAND